jgi:hypothetical protein
LANLNDSLQEKKGKRRKEEEEEEEEEVELWGSPHT